MASQKGLGKGLGALLGDFTEEPLEKSAYQLLPIYKVEPNPDQPRHDFDEEELQALADSITVHGIIQPLTVREMPNGYYQIIAGERRWRAARMAGLTQVPAVVIEADDRKAMELAMIENLQREDLNPIEEAEGYKVLMEQYGMTQEETAKRVGKSRPAVANAVRLLTQSGLRHIDYKNGVTRQIDTAVRNAVLTASAQLSGEIMQANIEESGVAYVQVSAHWGARDSHAVWQGKVYSLAEFRSVCGYGEPSNPDHIYSYNCRHTHYPYWPGISEPVEYPPEPGPFEADGKTYTYYQATQRQRAMERSIRAMKRDALAQDAMGDKGALAAAKIRLDEKTAAYKRFSAQVNMRPRLERTQVFGYDRGAAARAHSAVEKELAKAPAALQSSTMRDIIGIGDDRLTAEIEIEIDRFTPCLVDRKTGMRVATTYTFASKSDLANLRRKGWIFNWTGDDLKGADIYKLRLKGDTEIQGLIALREFRSDAAVYIQLAESAPFNIGKNKRYDGVGGHLFAIAAKKSADAGYGGFLFLDAKNMDLVEHYKMAFGARHIGGVHPYRMLIDEENAMKLLKIYNFEEG